MAARDYYKTLGVERTASADEIKKSYRKLALKYHPDTTEGDKVLEEKFKEVNEAYAVLSDPDKRKQYDTFGADGFNQRYSQEEIFKNFDLGSVFSEFGFGGGGGPGGGGDFFSSIFGGGGRSQRPQGRGRQGYGGYGFPGGGQPQRGQDIEYELTLSLEEAFAGGKKTLSLPNQPQTVTVTIPPGISTGQKLRLSGKGHPAPQGPAGDLFLVVRTQPHPTFERHDDDLTVRHSISFTEAALGTQIEIPTIDGTNVTLKVPAGTSPGTKMRLRGRGMPCLKKKEPVERGNAYVELAVSFPTELTDEQRAWLEQLRESGL